MAPSSVGGPHLGLQIRCSPTRTGSSIAINAPKFSLGAAKLSFKSSFEIPVHGHKKEASGGDAASS